MNNHNMTRVSFHIRHDQLDKLERYKIKKYGNTGMVDNAKVYRLALDELFERARIK